MMDAQRAGAQAWALPQFSMIDALMNSSLLPAPYSSPEYGARAYLPRSDASGRQMFAEMAGRETRPAPFATPSVSADQSVPMWMRYLPAPSSAGENVSLAANIIGGPALRGIRAYHGSPHKFDRFDMSRIGTGEGAQAYGHGIYLAESPAVAESYRTAGTAGNMPAPTYKAPSNILSSNAENFGQFAVSNPLFVKGFGSLDVERRGAVLPMVRGLLDDPEIGKAVVRLLPVDVMHMLGGKQFAAKGPLDKPSMLVDLLPTHANDLVPGRVQAMDVLAPYVALATAKRPLIGPQSRAVLEEALAARGAGKGDLHVGSEVPYPSQGGNMYEVNIRANPEQFLDWEKPFAQQSPQVQRGVRSVLEGDPVPQSSDAARGYDVYNQIVNRGLDTRPSIFRDDRLLWQEGAKKRPIASSMLNEAGIPGIKYLDQGSRTVGQGSSNYVVFDDSIIDILKRYGLMGAAVAPTALGIPPAQAPIFAEQ